MKKFASVYIVSLCAVLGLARPDGDDNLLGGKDPCSILGYEGPAHSSRILANKISSCLLPDKADNIQEQLAGATTIEHFKEVVKGHCDKAPIFQECIVVTKELASRCLTDPVELGKFKVLANLMKLLLEVSCLQDGARLASILQEMSLSNNQTSGFIIVVNHCLLTAGETVDTEAATVSQYSLQQYQMLRKFKTCSVDYASRHEVQFEHMIAVLNEIVDVLPCVGVDSAEPILCKTLVAQRCAAREGNLVNTAEQLYNMSLSQVLECTSQDENSSSIVSQFNEAHTEVEYQLIFKGFCQISVSARQCLVNTKLNGEFCIQGEFWYMFRGVSNMMDMAHEAVCEDDGVKLSTILAAVRAAATTSDNFTERCFMAAVEGFKDEAKWRQNYRLVHYHVLRNLKSCIADYGMEHNHAAVNLVSFLDDKVEAMRCYDDPTDHYVLCNTLVN